MPTVHEILAAAAEQHRRRSFADAERGYRQVLQLDSNNVDAHHLLGVLLFETKRADEALASLDNALRLNPGFADAHYNLGRVLAELGRFDEAIQSYQRAIQCRPNFAHAHYNLGNLFNQLGRVEEAITSIRGAIESDPNYAKAYTNLGHLLLQRGNPDGAKCFERAVALEPTSVHALANLAKALRETGDLDRAESLLSRAISLDANSAAAWGTLGMIRMSQSRPEEALAMLETSLRLRPEDAETINNIGSAQIALGRSDEAIASLRRAIELRPDLAAAHTNLGNALYEAGALGLAIKRHERAIQLRPDFAQAHFNLGIAHLLAGDFDRGWSEYARRIPSQLEPKTHPRWQGEPLARKTILLYPEQGMGDTIQFIRLAPQLQARGARVIFGCPAPLIRLLETVPGIDQVLPDRAPLPPFDFYVPLLNLPGLLGVNLANIPAEIPYVFPPAALVEAWRGKLAPLTGFRIGIAWQGNPKHKGDRQRSVRLEIFEPLSRMLGVRLVSLQQGFGVEQIAAVRDRFAVHDPGVLEDFLESAAVMRNLDLVVTVDTAIAHLAGALGIPTFVALPLVPDWRWLLNREDSPWYPSVQLFRQQHRREWEPVFARIVESVSALMR